MMTTSVSDSGENAKNEQGGIEASPPSAASKGLEHLRLPVLLVLDHWLLRIAGLEVDTDSR